ncbi:hypothetical protein [Candidatus Palauibacter sp.]|uniref:hypothetical protein n=1 Tax=Candidatus Palauibacter sp. TaxID=3101350 RepID=UPI003B017083
MNRAPSTLFLSGMLGLFALAPAAAAQTSGPQNHLALNVLDASSGEGWRALRLPSLSPTVEAAFAGAPVLDTRIPAQASEGQKSAAVAGVLELFVPFVGHAYAGDVGAGLLPGVVRIGGLGLAFVGAGIFAEDVLAGVVEGEVDESGGLGLAAAGFLAYTVGTIWGTVSAVSTANRHNARLQESGGLENVGLTVRPTRDGVLVGVGWRVF